MPLIICPDCNKQISDRANSCPFCGCPSEYFPKSTNSVESPSSDNDMCAKPQSEKTIDFHFGDCTISYPESISGYAKLYGKYVRNTDLLTKKYLNQYDNADNFYEVVTTLTDKAEKDIDKIIEHALTDLYSYEIIISFDDFKQNYVRDFREELIPLFEQLEEIAEMIDNLEYERDRTKASRGRWVGGGFGIKGAIKGAINAHILNAGSDLFHSIGDGLKKSSDDKKIQQLMNKAYYSRENKLLFLESINYCCADILSALTMELNKHGLIDISYREKSNEISTLFETTTKYEKNHDKYFSNIIRCIKSEPKIRSYYWKILPDLFEKTCDLKEFLDFWNLSNFYDEFYKLYVKPYIDGNSIETSVKVLLENTTDPYTIGCVHGAGNQPKQLNSFGVSNNNHQEKGIMVVVAEGNECSSNNEPISQIIVDRMLRDFDDISQNNSPTSTLIDLTWNANEIVNSDTIAAVKEKSRTSVISIIVRNQQLSWISVGNSIIYVYRSGQLVQLTHGKDGYLEIEDIDEYIDVNQAPIKLEKGDRILLLDSGVYGTVDAQSIVNMMTRPFEDTLSAIEQAIQTKDKSDQANYTCVMVEIK